MDDQIFIVFGGFLSVFLSFLFWRQATFFVMYWIIIVGAVRKWVFPQYADFLFFSSHVILTGVYARILIRNYRLKTNKLTTFFLTLMVLWGFASIFNPRSPDIRVGVLGFIIHFYFLPLAFVVPQLFRSHKELVRFLKGYALFSFPILILGVVQFLSPANSFLNKYVSETTDIAMVGKYPRITGTFSYISGYGAYLNAMVVILTYLISIKNLSFFWRFVYSALIPLSIVNLFMTGSRGSLGVSLFTMVMFFFVASKLGVRFILRIIPRLAIVLILAFGFLTVSSGAKTAYNAFKVRAEEGRDVSARLLDTFTPFKFLDTAGLIGWGIGTTYQGAARFASQWGGMTRDFEEEPERVLLELGLIGYFLIFFCRLLLIFEFWRLFNRLRHVDFKLLALSSLLFQVQFLQLTSLIFNHTSSVFYWFFVGFLFLLPRLDIIHERPEKENHTVVGAA